MYRDVQKLTSAQKTGHRTKITTLWDVFPEVNVGPEVLILDTVIVLILSSLMYKKA